MLRLDDDNRTAKTAAAKGDRWTAEAAHDWYRQIPWLVGCNFIPSYAINQLEFWQAETFDLVAIDRELAWAAALGMNAARVYLHDLLWMQDSKGFTARIDAYLAVASRHGIRTMLVLFDSCWDPDPALGQQREPMPGVHNSGWVQSPGMPALSDFSQHERLKSYVSGVVGAFANDDRVLAWDIWNEPDNGPEVALCDAQILAAKSALVIPLLTQAFGWARDAGPTQPLTSAIWLGNWSADHKLSPIQRLQTASSDIISFHNYGKAKEFGRRVRWLKSSDAPLFAPNIWPALLAAPSRLFFQRQRKSVSQHFAGAWSLVGPKRIWPGTLSIITRFRKGRAPGSTTFFIRMAARTCHARQSFYAGSQAGPVWPPRNYCDLRV